ncbi:MAG: long-chain fatty acid--CoA ligase [Alphaproteobacteria bacterium]|nr:long-chain fatty acid--CoA ligase [Alphaproteobacteria bacterium]
MGSYPSDVDWNAPLPASTLPDMFDEAVSAFGPQPLTDFLGKKLSFSELGAATSQLAAGLQKAGIKKGSKIGLFLPNCPYYISCYFAALKLGAIVINFNPLYTEEEIEYQARDAGIELMVTLDLKLLFDKMVTVAKSGAVDRVMVCPFPDLLPTIKKFLFKIAKGKELASVDDAGLGDRLVHYDTLVANDGTFTPAELDAETDIALFQYTGGTTGVPKGAMLTHANLAINCEQIRLWSTGIEIGNERIMAILPFFHVFAMTCIMNTAIKCGFEIIIMPRFDLDQAVKIIKSAKPTLLPGVPTLYTALMNHKDLDAGGLSSLKYCMSGGAPLPLEVRRKFEALAGCGLIEGYGLSETSPVATANPYNGLEKENSIGQPLPGTYISIRSLDDPAAEMKVNENGEICIAGPQVMNGYWNKPKETAETFSGEYFRTGDVGYMDEDGFIYIVDRIKDMINCSGFKVYPRRIEDAIYAHPAVDEVTVIGVPDDYRGETPKAFIKLKPGQTATEEDIRKTIEPKLAKIELPEYIEFRDELPKTMVGKLSKKELRQSEPSN